VAPEREAKKCDQSLMPFTSRERFDCRCHQFFPGSLAMPPGASQRTQAITSSHRPAPKLEAR